MKNKMSSKEALDVFYKDIQAYNNDMRTYPYFKCYQNKCEADMRVWEKKQSEMYETIKADLDRLEILEKELLKDRVAVYETRTVLLRIGTNEYTLGFNPKNCRSCILSDKEVETLGREHE